MKKLSAWILILALLVSLLPAAAFATEPVETGTEETTGRQVASALLGAHESSAKAFEQEENEIDPDQIVRVIVLLDESEIPESGRPTRAAQTRMLRAQKAVQREISQKVLGGAALTVQNSYCTLTNGFSADVTYAQLKEIRELDGVEAAFISPTFELEPSMTTSNQMVGGGMYNTTGYTGEGTVVAILDTGVDLDHELFAAAPKNPRLTQADIQKVLEENDLSCEKDVPSVGASTLYYSAKIPFQFDYGDHDADGNPVDGDSGHGTHVAGTAAGNAGVKDGFSGVAPQAQILNMKVFKSSGGASYDDIVAALEDCMVIGVDSVNMSLGSDCGFIDYESQDEWTTNLINVFDRVGKSGIGMAVAVGNAYSAAHGNNYGGKSLASNPDYGNASEPATYHESLAVGAVENAGMVSPYITVNGRDIAYYDGYDGTTQEVTTEWALRTIANKGSLEYVMVGGYGSEEDFAAVDVKGKIAVVQRGGGMYYEAKANNAAAAGAVGLIVYNNAPGMIYMSISEWKLPIGFISQQDGAYLAKQEDKHLTIAVADKLVTSPVAGMCDFTSWGATSELTLKPEITAPGGNIYSAVPGNGTYELMSGTSMASPHVAGGMAIVSQAIKAQNPDMNATERKHLIDTLLMSTATIIYDGDVPVSPRRQGAGMMDINAAVKTKGYITVNGMDRPKMELGDDVAETGVYALTFTVHNTGDETLYYNASPIVLTDGTHEDEGKTLMTETDVVLPSTYTTNVENGLVAVPAHGEKEVTITVTLTDPKTTLAKFENGAYVEGWAVLKAANADGSENEDGISLSAPFLAFYGDWTKAPIIDSGFWWDKIADEETDAQTYDNEALLESMEKTMYTYLGENNYDYTVPYFADRNAISPNNDDFLDSLTWVYTGLLRSARTLTYKITGTDGTVYYEKTVDYEPKSIYNNSVYQVAPAGAFTDNGDAIDPWYGTDINDMSLPNNTKATVSITTTPIYNKHASSNLRDSWSFPITVDTEAPEVVDMSVRESEGRYYATVTVKDNQYVAAVVLTDSKYNKVYDTIGVGETEPGKTTVLKDIDITGFGETVGLTVHDYAGNSKQFYLKAKGNLDDYADVVVTDDMVLYSEDFQDNWLPDGWSTESKSQSVKGWIRDEDWFAGVEGDEIDQNEWLYSPAYDLSGQSTPTHMVFTFNTSYTFCVQYPHFNVTVYVSSDNGANWEPIWNLHDSGLYADWTNTQAKVVIPDAYQGKDNVRFAFVYTSHKGGAAYGFRGMKIYKDRAEDYVAVQASAAENGTISPSGRTLVRKGTSKTFSVTPNPGYEVASLVVDGVDLGPISYYTFEMVGVDHTVSATFKPAEGKTTYTVNAVATEGGSVTPSGVQTVPANGSVSFTAAPQSGFRFLSYRVNGRRVSEETAYTLENVDQNYYVEARFELIPETPEVLFEQDFESEQFPPEGWERSGGSETWRRYSYYYLNKTQAAYVSAGEAKQDERLIAPAINLRGAKETNLEFDYAYPYYGMKRGEFTFTVEASADGGSTWTTVWDAKDTVGDSMTGYVVSDRAFVELPSELCVDNLLLSWHYTRPAGEDYSGIAAIDNVKMEATGVQTDIEGYAKITATAGEGGSINPIGRTYVKEGESQTFTITPMAGYTISAVLVDGTSVGAVTSYTFENVTGSHTIEARFKVSSGKPGVIFEQDFEDESFPSRGWTVDSKADSSMTWEKSTLSYLNKTNAAVVTNDYEDWSNAHKQDEYLISPAVDLSGKTAVLSFDYALGRYALQSGQINLTVVASTDNGETWAPIWDASKLTIDGVLYQTGSAEVTVPVLYCKESVRFAFRYTRSRDAEGDKAAVDNIALKDPSALCEHTETELRDVKAPTCTDDGYTGNTYCKACGVLLKTGTVIPALGHDLVTDAAVPATCTESGLTEGSHCTRCDYKVAQEVVPATGHTEAAPVRENEVAATCTEAGSYDEVVYCSVCHAELSRAAKTINALGHDLVDHEAKAATCTEAGWAAYQTCTRCDYTTYKEIPATGHTEAAPVRENEVAATCTEAGSYDEVVYCSVCHAELSRAAKTINALGHDLVDHEAKAATCTEAGWAAYQTCTRCDYTTYKEIPATGHTFENGVCTVCGAADPDYVKPEEPWVNPFVDVRESAWYFEGVRYAAQHGLFNGTSATTFEPEADMTRAMLVTVLWRMAEQPEPTVEVPFTDTSRTDYYAKAVAWAYENKVVNGTSPTTFDPDGKITREQIATILYRYAEKKGYDVSKQNDLSGYPDADKVSGYARTALAWANALELVKGTNEGGVDYLDPQGHATRAQVATILMRYAENVVK